MGNLKGRVERLEGGRKGRGIPIIILGPGESKEEAIQKHLAQHSEDEKAELMLIIKGTGQAPLGAPPPPRPEPQDSPKAPGPAPVCITR